LKANGLWWTMKFGVPGGSDRRPPCHPQQQRLPFNTSLTPGERRGAVVAGQRRIAVPESTERKQVLKLNAESLETCPGGRPEQHGVVWMIEAEAVEARKIHHQLRCWPDRASRALRTRSRRCPQAWPVGNRGWSAIARGTPSHTMMSTKSTLWWE